MSSWARIPPFGDDVVVTIVRHRRRAGFIIDIGEPFIDVKVRKASDDPAWGSLVTVLSGHDGLIQKYFLHEGAVTHGGEPYAELYTAVGAMIVPKIFVSYRQADTGATAGRLFERLREHFGRWQVFFDLDALEPSRSFVTQVIWAIERTQVMVVLIGKEWARISDANENRRIANRNDLHRREIAAALKRGTHILPLLVEGAEMPRREDLPRSIAPLSDRQALPISHGRWEADVARIRDTIERLLR